MKGALDVMKYWICFHFLNFNNYHYFYTLGGVHVGVGRLGPARPVGRGAPAVWGGRHKGPEVERE